MTRIVGPPGSRRRRRFLAVPILLTMMVGLLFIGTAAAVHDLDFQLDGNVATTPDTNVGGTTQEIDWADLFDANGDELPLPTGFDASVFDDDFQLNANGTFNTADTSTWATGSKDTLNVSGGGQSNGTWQCRRDNNLLDKNDIMNAYAASYSPAGGAEILYFALERNGNEGAANVGFWFLQDGTVDCNAPGGGNFQFTGNHVDGDLLVVSEFTQGGTVSTIQVYRWTGGANGCIDDPDTPGSCDGQAVASGADCLTEPTGDDACATVNSVSITTPWLTVDKTTVGHTLDVREFFEGGINLTATGLGGKCFNTFMASTRASQELGSNLHDFSRGELGGCTSTTVTTPSISSAVIPAHGTLDVTDSATITVTGSSDWDGEVKFFLCRSSELDTDGECSSGGTQIGSAVPVTEETTMPVSSATAGLTAVDDYCWRAEFTSTTDGVPDSSDHSTTECFEVTPRQPVLTTDATDGPVDFGQPISDTISLTNTADKPGTNGIGPGGTINATNRQPAGGTISFTAFGPGNCTTVAHSGTISVSGDNTAYGGPGSVTQFTPTAPGVYTYVASYTGDPPNTLGVPTTACPDPTGTEVVTVRQIPTTILTDQWVYPNDSATVSSTVASRELPTGGEIVFKLYDTVANCQANGSTGLLGTFTDSTVGGGGAGNTARTNNTTVEVQADATVAWRVTYDPKNSAFTGRQSACVERTAVDFTDDPGPGTLFP